MSLTKVMNQPTFAESYERWLVPFLFRPWEIVCSMLPAERE